MRQANVVTGPALALLGLVLVAASPVLGDRGCLVGSLTTGACGTGGNLMTALGVTIGLAFLVVGYAAFTRGLAGY
jgi:hypothetical protein